MDNIDRKILILFNEGIPIEKRPFKSAATELMLTEEEIVNRINNLKKEGFIQRFGGVLNLKQLGYISTLCAMSVPEHKVVKTARMVNSYDEVTYNHIREHYYNMWFTVIAESEEKIDEIIENIKKDTGINALINLPSIKLFKINSPLDLGGDSNER